MLTPLIKKGTPRDKHILSDLLDKSCTEHLQQRVTNEDTSARLYLAMSLWLENKGYVNAAALWRVYANEEMTHADWARKYLLSFGVLPETRTLEEVKMEFTGLPQIIEASLEHEVKVTKECKELANHALKDGDHMLHTLAHKYLTEQIGELEKLTTLKDQLEAFGTDKIAMRLFDHELKDYL